MTAPKALSLYSRYSFSKATCERERQRGVADRQADRQTERQSSLFLRTKSCVCMVNKQSHVLSSSPSHLRHGGILAILGDDAVVSQLSGRGRGRLLAAGVNRCGHQHSRYRHLQTPLPFGTGAKAWVSFFSAHAAQLPRADVDCIQACNAAAATPHTFHTMQHGEAAQARPTACASGLHCSMRPLSHTDMVPSSHNQHQI